MVPSKVIKLEKSTDGNETYLTLDAVTFSLFFVTNKFIEASSQNIFNNRKTARFWCLWRSLLREGYGNWWKGSCENCWKEETVYSRLDAPGVQNFKSNTASKYSWNDKLRRNRREDLSYTRILWRKRSLNCYFKRAIIQGRDPLNI